MHEKIPTDENLKNRGCIIPTMFSLCCANDESSMHLFFQCHYAVRLWLRFACAINKVLQFSSIEDMLEAL